MCLSALETSLKFLFFFSLSLFCSPFGKLTAVSSEPGDVQVAHQPTRIVFLEYTGSRSVFPSGLSNFTISLALNRALAQTPTSDCCHLALNVSPITSCAGGHIDKEHVMFAAIFPCLLGHHSSPKLRSHWLLLSCILNLFCRRNQNELLRERDNCGCLSSGIGPVGQDSCSLRRKGTLRRVQTQPPCCRLSYSADHW